MVSESGVGNKGVPTLESTEEADCHDWVLQKAEESCESGFYICQS